MHPKIHNFVLDASEKNTSPTQSFHYSQKHQHVRPLARGTKPLFTEKQKEKLNMSAFKLLGLQPTHGQSEHCA